jgi:hypothetical protein
MWIYNAALTILLVSISDPDSESGMGKKSGTGMNILDHFSESLETIFRVYADPVSGIFLTRDPG